MSTLPPLPPLPTGINPSGGIMPPPPLPSGGGLPPLPNQGAPISPSIPPLPPSGGKVNLSKPPEKSPSGIPNGIPNVPPIPQQNVTQPALTPRPVVDDSKVRESRHNMVKKASNSLFDGLEIIPEIAGLLDKYEFTKMLCIVTCVWHLVTTVVHQLLDFNMLSPLVSHEARWIVFVANVVIFLLVMRNTNTNVASELEELTEIDNIQSMNVKMPDLSMENPIKHKEEDYADVELKPLSKPLEPIKSSAIPDEPQIPPKMPKQTKEPEVKNVKIGEFQVESSSPFMSTLSSGFGDNLVGFETEDNNEWDDGFGFDMSDFSGDTGELEFGDLNIDEYDQSELESELISKLMLQPTQQETKQDNTDFNFAENEYNEDEDEDEVVNADEIVQSVKSHFDTPLVDDLYDTSQLNLEKQNGVENLLTQLERLKHNS